MQPDDCSPNSKCQWDQHMCGKESKKQELKHLIKSNDTEDTKQWELLAGERINLFNSEKPFDNI